MQNKNRLTPYLTALGAFALSFGCAVGQGAFLMPGNTFLPQAGPVGTAIGICIGAVVMMFLAMNYHYLVNKYPDNGGAYAYTKHIFGYDHGFLNAWFLGLMYIAIMWANASGLPFLARILLGDTFQFGFSYDIAGYHIFFGEVLLAMLALILGAFLCMRRSLAVKTQVVMALVVLAGVTVIFTAALTGHQGNRPLFQPAFASEDRALVGVFTIFAIAPWAFAGFESVAHSAEETTFSLRKTFRILVIALVAGAFAYSALTLLAATALPAGCSDWTEYIANLGEYEGARAFPVFYAAQRAMGSAGLALMGAAAVCGMVTGIIGNMIALSRLLCSLAQDNMMPAWLGEVSENHVPRKAILAILGGSLFIPFLGRACISWVVDVTTVGAVISYAFVSASALKSAKEEDNTTVQVTGTIGLVISVFFTLAFLIPNLLSVTTLSTESYLILAAWGILGFVVLRYLLSRDTGRRLGRSNVSMIVMLGLIIFTSTVWMWQATNKAIEKTVDQEQIKAVDATFGTTSIIQVVMIVVAMILLFAIYARIQQREKEVEVEKALAEKASQAKTSFLSNMSHEIRTPMNAIIGLDNIALRNPNLSPQTREQLEKIGASANHLLGLINDILDMSRIESGRVVLKEEEFSFREFLDQVNIIINGQCQDKGLHYECNIVGHADDYYVGDDMKLKQVLINILGNSVKFTEPPGEVILTVGTVGRTEDARILRFDMKDTGIGMDKEYIPKIFEAFSQEDTSNITRYGGTGLGMSITKSFVEMMEGEIHVESEKGVGSLFSVTVKLGASARVFHAEQGIRLPEGLRAIVVDDDEVSCEHARMVLAAIGIETDIATEPMNGLAMIRGAHDMGQPYPLVLTDYKMPDMNGMELVRAVRAFDDGESAIIMLTGYNYDIIEDEAMRDGVNSIMSKPLFSDSLTREIYSILLDKGEIEVPIPEEEPEEEMAGAGLAGRRILMAEDVMQNAEILEDLLDLEEMQAEHAVNGQIAVEMFSEHPAGYYDAILMDVRMPVMDGLTATSSIRALPRPDAKIIPIIAMTANVFDEDVERSMAAGMNAHLAKPVEPDSLYATLSKYIAEAEEKEE